jgi:hypothetical protein
VAYKVGPGSIYKYLVINMHYANTVKNDFSGVAIKITDKRFVIFIK